MLVPQKNAPILDKTQSILGDVANVLFTIIRSFLYILNSVSSVQ